MVFIIRYWAITFVKLSGPFTVIGEHLNTVLPNFYDAIGLMLMIRIIHQNQVAEWGENIILYILNFVSLTFKVVHQLCVHVLKF